MIQLASIATSVVVNFAFAGKLVPISLRIRWFHKGMRLVDIHTRAGDSSQLENRAHRDYW